MARSTDYRRKLKENDPEKYQEYLAKQRQRSREARQKLKDDVNLGIEAAKLKQNKVKAQARLRLLKFRNKDLEPKSKSGFKLQIKLKEGSSAPESNRKINKGSVNTRYSVANKREYWREYKRQYREKLGSQKKRRIQEKDR